MGVRPWLILAVIALARIGFGYQFQTVATLGPDLVRRLQLDYATLGTLIGAYMLLARSWRCRSGCWPAASAIAFCWAAGSP